MPDMQALRQNRLSAFAVRSAPSIPTTTGLAATIAVLRTSPTGCVLAMDGNILRGIFTERDYLQRVVLHDLPPTTTLGDIMTPDPLTLRVGADCTDFFKEGRDQAEIQYFVEWTD